MALHSSQLTSLRRVVGGCSEILQTTSQTYRSWQHIQKLKHFWRHWHREYLNELNIRNKCSKGSHDIREGAIVILREDNVPPMQWPLGRIIKVQPGADASYGRLPFDRSIKQMVALTTMQGYWTND
ncbi:uncharacterized protein LOC112213535 [Bombus impatiens]|uniref:Uncharacterized protein LOC112213535 n=1 Tax=Bombus impatiens TaxID=132113 RepID=A0A6P6FGQ4_BOMIM|nr:uncharacterized protein LOC112213535 [Bombus impatiens]